MGNWEKQQEVRRESLEKTKSYKENLGKFFYDLARLTFAGLVIGGIAPLYSGDVLTNNWFIVLGGAIATALFAIMAGRIIK